MGGYFSSKRDSSSRDEDSEAKRRKMNGRDLGILKSKEYQIVYNVGPVRVEELPPQLRSMFVFRKVGSMYFDEDGDLAHEFYVEEKRKHTAKEGVVKWTMKRIVHKLTPEGEVELDFPRIRTTVPVVLLDSCATIVPR